MATISYAVPASGGHPASTAKGYLMSAVVDAAVIVATPITIGTTDTIQVLKIPAGATVLAAGIDVLTAETTNTTCKYQLGDGGDTARYVDAVIVNSTGSLAQAATNADNFVYDSADTIDILISVDDPVNAKVRVWAHVLDFTDPDVTDRKTWVTA